MKAVCGLDVHKDSIYPCILHSDGELFEQVFGVLTFQLEGYPMRGKSFSFYRGKIQNYSIGNDNSLSKYRLKAIF